MQNVLKRLELNGFKSFAGKTALEFPKGITAIVGPNGSGKSNIVDAIRWLLGEREAKNLRGVKAEDLIFAGTAKRPRVGQAQASLHFENGHKIFPIDGAEVLVLREVRRDGASRYFLNKAEVRLRDLIDFFAKARLGTKGLTVIGQGQSDVFIQASPTARREMIEEMLGLREYQLKKSRSENRLKESKINLEKAGALVEEILPHLRSLKRQTSRWEKREVLQEELKDLENLFFGSQSEELEEKISIILHEIQGHKQEHLTLEKEKELTEEAEKKLGEGEPRDREVIIKLKRETQELLEKKSLLHKDLGRLEAELEFGKTTSTQTPSTKHLIEFLKKIKSRLQESVEMDFVELGYTLKDVMEEIDEFLAGGEPARAESEMSPDIKLKFSILEKQLKEIDSKITEIKKEEESLEKSQDKFYTDFKSTASAFRQVMEKIEEWEGENQKRLFEKERLELRREELARQIAQAGRDKGEFASFRVTEERKRELTDLAGVEKRIFKLRGDLASIGEIDRDLVEEAKKTEERYQFLIGQSKDLEKARGDLEEIISDLSEKVKIDFDKALMRINEEFNNFFRTMFGGGQAKLKLKAEIRSLKSIDSKNNLEEGGEAQKTKEEKELEKEAETGIYIDLKLPRKHAGSLDMLSGGERSLVGIAALFALISVSPPPFLVLDEVDAALDEGNARRFAEILKEFSKKMQFIVVTHNRATMEVADVLYGVTLNEDGTSKILSLKLETAT